MPEFPPTIRICTWQRDALQQAGCDKIYTDQQSGVSTDRSGLDTVLEVARSGDTLVIWRLDRLGRSLKNLIHLVEQLERQGVGFEACRRTSTPPPVAVAWYSIYSAPWPSSSAT